jgi:hypothetical protein
MCDIYKEPPSVTVGNIYPIILLVGDSRWNTPAWGTSAAMEIQKDSRYTT